MSIVKCFPGGARHRVAALMALVLMAGSQVGRAATPEGVEVGVADLVVSQVRGLRGQITRELAIQDDVFSEEIIQTEADAATRIVFLDGTELSMGPSSRMVLDRYVYDPNSGLGEVVMNMVTGVFEFASGAIPSAGYDLRTPFGNLAVRGTRCALAIAPGERLVLKCSELESVSIAGQTLDSADDCLLVPFLSAPEFLSAEECVAALEPAVVMAGLLGLPSPVDIAPGAGPAPAGGFGGGAGGGDSPFSVDPPGVSPQ